MTAGTKDIKLKRQLGLIHGVGVILGLVIGSGIYISPKGVIIGAGSPGLALIIWLVCGIAGTNGALTFAELGTTFPKAGEKYVYLEEMYGEFPSFIFLWMYMNFFRPGGNAIKCLTFAQYALQPFYNYGDDLPSIAVSLLGICLACLLTFINIVRIKLAAHGQTFCSSITITVLLLISVLGLIYVARGNTEHIAPHVIFKDTNTNAGEITLAVYSCMFANMGWNALNFMIEELKDPIKNLPRAIYISMALMTTLYLGVNFAYFAVLGSHGVIQSNAVAVSLAQKCMGYFSWLIPVVVTITCCGSYNSGIMVGSRLTYAAGRRGHLPKILGLVDISFLSPITSLIYQTILVIIMCTTFDIYTILNNMTFLIALFDAITVMGMIHLRWTKPDMERPLKFPLVIPLVYLLFCIFLIIVPIFHKPRSVVIGLFITLVTGVPYYCALQLWKRGYRLSSLENYYRKTFHIVQKILYCVPESSDIEH